MTLAQVTSTSPRGRELKNNKEITLWLEERSTSPRGRELKKHVAMVKCLTIWSTSTRGRELKMYYKMRVLKRILQTFLSYMHLYLRYTYRS